MTKKEFEEVLDPSRKQREKRMEEMKKQLAFMADAQKEIAGVYQKMMDEVPDYNMRKCFAAFSNVSFRLQTLAKAILLLMEDKSSNEGV